MMLGQLDFHMEEEAVPLLHTIYKKIKINQQSKYNSQNIKLLVENTGVFFMNLDFASYLAMTPKVQGKNNKINKQDKLDFIKTKLFLCIKGNYEENETQWKPSLNKEPTKMHADMGCAVYLSPHY